MILGHLLLLGNTGSQGCLATGRALQHLGPRKKRTGKFNNRWPWRTEVIIKLNFSLIATSEIKMNRYHGKNISVVLLTWWQYFMAFINLIQCEIAAVVFLKQYKPKMGNEFHSVIWNLMALSYGFEHSKLQWLLTKKDWKQGYWVCRPPFIC